MTAPVAKFEEGKPADPTENMTEEQKKEWWMHHEKNKDKFKQAAAELRSLVGGHARAEELSRLWRVTSDVSSFTRRAKAAMFSTKAVEFFLRNAKAAAEETDNEAKFEEGKPADPTENMSPEDAAEWKRQHDKNKDKFKSAGDDLEDEKQSKEAAGGLYGYTKSTQRDVEASVRKIERQAKVIASTIWAKDERVAAFLAVHGKRASSMPARILSAAFEGMVSRRAAEVTAGAAEYGLYGYHARTARLGLNACSDLRDFAGRVAYDLHSRRQANYGHITGYLKEHTKAAKCRYSRLLLDSYPDAPTGFTASDDSEPEEKTAASQDYDQYVRDYKALQKKYPKAVPKAPLSKEEWEKSLQGGKKASEVPLTVEGWLAWDR